MEGRTTRSSKKRLSEAAEIHLQGTRGSKVFLSDAAILTPPQSQSTPTITTRRWRGKRQYEDPLDQPPPTPTYSSSSSSCSSRKRTRYGDEVSSSSSSFPPSLEPPCSTSSNSLETTFHNDDITLEFGVDFWQGGGVDGLASQNDPFLPDVDNTKDGRGDLHTPTPSLSPRDEYGGRGDMSPSGAVDLATTSMPKTPMPRPGTPDYNPLASMTIPSLDQDDVDDDNDTGSLVAASTLSNYGPPPTPMCPSRVGNLSSSSSSATTSLLQISSAIRLRNTPPSTTSAAPPLNILDTDDDDDEDVVVIQNNQINSNSHINSNETPPHPSLHDNNKNSTLLNNPITPEDDNLDSPKISSSSNNIDNIVDHPKSSSPPPLSPPGGSISKHSRRLRIRAPPLSSRSRRSEKNQNGKHSKHRDRPSSSHSIKSILKTSHSKGGRPSLPSYNKRSSVDSVKFSVNFVGESNRSKEKINKIRKKTGGGGVMPMPPPLTPKPGTVPNPSSPTSSQNGALPLSVRKAAYPPEIVQNDSYIRDGNIAYLELNNFMAHKKSKWTFGRGLIFFIGPNGCGKSATQLAIKIVVGAKAANTLRAKSIKNLIKKGCLYAEIEGHFTNYNGTLPKKKYGDLIKLKRRIKYTGSSTYTVVEEGRWRPIKQDELGLITHSLNIDPNNPFQFLGQDRDSSKSGSSQQSNKDFNNFKQATQLTAIEDMLKTSEENVAFAEAEVEDKEEMKRFFALQEKQFKEELDQILKMESSENRLAELECELQWSKVKVMKEEEKKIQADKADVYAQLTELKEGKKKIEDDISNFSNMEDKKKKLLQDAKRQWKQLESGREAKTQEMRKAKQTQQRALSQHGAIITKIRQYTEEIEKLEKELNKDTISYEAENQKHRADIEMNRALIEEQEVKLNDLRDQRDKILAEINEYKATQRKVQSRIAQLESQLRETNRELTKKDNFGRHMKELLKRIECKSWTRKPIGPLGQHIQVPDENAKYAPLIEHVLYYALFTFVVQTKEDFVKLKDLIKEVYNDKEKDKGKVRDPTVIQIPDINKNDYMRRLKKVKDALSSFPTVLSMLNIKDPMVEIGIVERTNCERIILFDNNKDAASIMKDDKQVPPEVNSGFTLQWFKVTPYPRYQFQPLQGMIKYTTEFIPMARGETTLKVKEEIARNREVEETCKINLKGHNGFEKMLRQNDAEIQGVNKKINQLKNKIKESESLIRTESTQDQDRDVADQIKMVEEMRASREKEIQMPLQELELAKEKVSSIKDEIEKIDAQVPEVKKKLDDLEGDHDGTNRTVAKLTKEIEDYKVKILRLEREFQSLGDAETNIYVALGDLEKKASQAGPCPENLLRVPETVQRDLEDTKMYLDKNRHKLISKKRVLSEYNNSKALVLQITNEINLIKKLCEQFRPLIKVNTDYYEKSKKELSNQLTSNYRTLVEAHKLTGDLIMDWESGTLVYYVCPDKNAEKKAKQSYSNKDGEMVVSDKQGVYNYVQNLSGGERSKALVFFIMAMWKITDMPFHILDEFEACLDYESRKDIHDKIIQHAKKHIESQFFILTPLELPPINPEEKDFVTIIQLKKT